MKTGEICLHIIRVLLGLLGAFKAHLILKYLNKKALGMQTIFDLTIKDLIYIYSLTWGSSFFLFALPTILVEELEMSVNHYVALILAYYFQFVVLVGLWQFFVILIIRYHEPIFLVWQVLILKSVLYIIIQVFVSVLLDILGKGGWIFGQKNYQAFCWIHVLDLTTRWWSQKWFSRKQHQLCTFDKEKQYWFGSNIR